MSSTAARCRSIWTSVILASSIWLCASGPAMAGNQARAGINLGATSFYDGFGRPVGGFSSQLYLQYSTAQVFRDFEGNEVTAFRNPQFDTFVWLNQLSYTIPAPLFGNRALAGINAILPVVGFHTSFDAGGPQPRSNGVGLGDLAIGPTLQFLPIIVDNRPFFSHRFEFDVIGLTGKYDPSYNFNQGTSFYSLNPYWAFTILPINHLEVTARVNWIYNFQNDQPVNPPPGLAVNDAQAGQQFWVNFAASYEVLSGLHVGANGYYLKQLTRDRFVLADGTETDGRLQGEGLQQVLGIGPGIFWEATKQERFYANVYFQLAVEARPQSNVLSVRWLHSF
ncbi:MAG: transporter [Polyangiales bacterium]